MGAWGPRPDPEPGQLAQRHPVARATLLPSRLPDNVAEGTSIATLHTHKPPGLLVQHSPYQKPRLLKVTHEPRTERQRPSSHLEVTLTGVIQSPRCAPSARLYLTLASLTGGAQPSAPHQGLAAHPRGGDSTSTDNWQSQSCRGLPIMGALPITGVGPANHRGLPPQGPAHHRGLPTRSRLRIRLLHCLP